MINKQLHQAISAIDTVIEQLRTIRIPDEIIVSAMARQLYNLISDLRAELKSQEFQERLDD